MRMNERSEWTRRLRKARPRGIRICEEAKAGRQQGSKERFDFRARMFSRLGRLGQGVPKAKKAPAKAAKPSKAPGQGEEPLDVGDTIVDAPDAKTIIIKPRMPFQSQVFFFIILAVVFYLTWKVFHEFIIVLITGIFVAVLALPIDKMWERVFPNRVAAIFTMLTLFLILTLPLIAVGFGMYKDATELAEDRKS